MLQTVSAVLVTQEHAYTGTVVTGGRRLLDILNDSLKEYVQVLDAQMFRGLDLRTPVASFPTVQVRKLALSMVALPQEGHEAPVSRFFGYVQKVPHHVLLAVPGFEVEGQLHMLPSTKPELVVPKDLDLFFPVTRAKLTRASAPFETMEVPVTMIHREMVELLCLGEPA